MKRSSAYKIQYDIRPAKQTERRILLDILKGSSEAGLDLSNYKYLGFGGFKFYDFEILFRHLGIKDMTSVEADKSLVPRCRFNKPFSFIELVQGSLSEYLDAAFFEKPLVAWLDYDSTLSRGVVDDIVTLSSKVPVGSFIFVTIDARMADGLRSLPSDQRIADLKEELQTFAVNPSTLDVEPNRFSRLCGARPVGCAGWLAFQQGGRGVRPPAPNFLSR
jgi:hypothetical protein